MLESKNSSGSSWFVWTLLGMVVVAIVLAFAREEVARKRLPPLPIISTVSDFVLTNQLHQPVSLGDLRGAPWVANVIFTRCPGPCLSLSKKFADLQSRLPEDSKARLVTITIDPAYDQPDVLNQYGKKLGADPDKWWFLTGETNQLKQLAIRDLKFSAQDKAEEEQESPDDLFIHSTYFMVVDAEGQLRAVVDTSMEFTSPNGETITAVDQTLTVLEQLD